jgi:uncharacterized membrane protein HdeD (DUF308 family)
MATVTPSPTPPRTYPWRPYLLLGVVLCLLGAAALGATLLDLISVVVFGPVFLVIGILQIFLAFMYHGGKETWLSLLAAALNITLGFLLLAHPHLGGIEIGLVVAGFLVAFGLVRAGRAYAAGKSRGGWLLVAGLAAVLLAACVWLRWPFPGIWFVGVCLAVDLIVYGIIESASSLTTEEFRDSRLPKRPAPQEAGTPAPPASGAHGN